MFWVFFNPYRNILVALVKLRLPNFELNFAKRDNEG
jgi:hypothetical protein